MGTNMGTYISYAQPGNIASTSSRDIGFVKSYDNIYLWKIKKIIRRHGRTDVIEQTRRQYARASIAAGGGNTSLLNNYGLYLTLLLYPIFLSLFIPALSYIFIFFIPLASILVLFANVVPHARRKLKARWHLAPLMFLAIYH